MQETQVVYKEGNIYEVNIDVRKVCGVDDLFSITEGALQDNKVKDTATDRNFKDIIKHSDKSDLLDCKKKINAALKTLDKIRKHKYIDGNYVNVPTVLVSILLTPLIGLAMYHTKTRFTKAELDNYEAKLKKNLELCDKRLEEVDE